MRRPDTWRCLESARPEHGYDAQVLHSVLSPEDAQGEPLGKRRIHDQLGCRLIVISRYGEAPRMSLALWAKALVASTEPAATRKIVLMSLVIAVSPFESMRPDEPECSFRPSDAFDLRGHPQESAALRRGDEATICGELPALPVPTFLTAWSVPCAMNTTSPALRVTRRPDVDLILEGRSGCESCARPTTLSSRICRTIVSASYRGT